MLNKLVDAWIHWWGGKPSFRIHGKTRFESGWRVIDIYANPRHDLTSRWPLMGGTCVTWSSAVIVVGQDFANQVLREQAECPASRDHPVEVFGGRLHDSACRSAANGPSIPTATEILAHEVGHTGQAIRLGSAYLPLVGAVTLFGEGKHWWNHFENQASAQGQFGGIVNGSVTMSPS